VQTALTHEYNAGQALPHAPQFATSSERLSHDEPLHRVYPTLADENVLYLGQSRIDVARLYALTATELYTSADGGATWIPIAPSGGRARTPRSSGIPDPFAFAILHAPDGGEVLIWSFPATGVHWSADSGATVVDDPAFATEDVLSIVADDATGLVYLSVASDPFAVEAPVVFRSNLPWSRNGAPLGLKWSEASSSLPGYPSSVVLSWTGEADSLVAAATGSDTLVYTSVDGGRQWTQRGRIPDGSVRPISVPDKGHFLVGSTVGYESLDSADPGYAWQPSRWHWSRHLITVDPRNPDHVAIVGNFSVTVSSDGAATAIVRQLPSQSRGMSVLYDSVGRLWVGTDGGVLVSADDGVSFQRVDVAIPDVYALAWTPGGGDEGTIYAGTRDGLYRRGPRDRFHRVLGGGGYVVSDVTVDPGCSSRIYVGFGFGSGSVHRGGVAVSNDGGSSWSSLSAGQEVHSVPITGIQVAPTNPKRIYVGTYGRGAWAFDFD